MSARDIEQMPQTRPFLAAAARFRSGADTPRAFLERCLTASAAWEPKIGAFVHTSFDAARVAADAASVRWKGGKPLSAIDGMPVGIEVDAGIDIGLFIMRCIAKPTIAAGITQ